MAGRLTKGQKALLWIGAVPILLYAGNSALVASYERQLQEKIVLAKSVGFPLDGESLQSHLEKPTGENAASHYADIESKFKQYIFTDFKNGYALAEHPTATTASPEELKKIEIFLDECDDLIASIDKGSRMPVCFFEKDWSKGADISFAEIADIRRSAKLVNARFRLRLRQGELDGAVDDIETISRIAEHTRQQPGLIGLLSSFAIDAICNGSIEMSLPLIARNEVLMSRCQAVVESLPESWDTRRVFLPEIYFQYWSADVALARGKILQELGFHAEDHTVTEKAVFVYMSQPIPLRKIKCAVLDVWMPYLKETGSSDLGESLSAVSVRTQNESSRSYVVKKYFDLVSPIFLGIDASMQSAIAKRRCLMGAIDIVRTHEKTGAYPIDVPKNLIDPFDGKPLRYKVENDGFRIWSIGADKKDNGGKQRGGVSNFDEVIIYPPVLKAVSAR